MKPTLLIIAAGMGSRYGGLKQIDPVGPNGEIIIDYSIYDAVAAGFEKIVFVIRRYFEEAFREKIARKLADRVETAYTYQELDACLDGFALPEGREKPWGTGHAILVARDVIDAPFAVINADDYYGTHSFGIVREQLERMGRPGHDDYAMVGYRLGNTLSEYGTVSRGVCTCDEQMYLRGVEECTKIARQNGRIEYTDEQGTRVLDPETIVSMNFWAFHPDVFTFLAEQFGEFLRSRGQEPKSEFYIPSAVDHIISTGRRRVKVLQTPDTWFGVTYQHDKDIARQRILELIDAGVYPEWLWS